MGDLRGMDELNLSQLYQTELAVRLRDAASPAQVWGDKEAALWPSLVLSSSCQDWQMFSPMPALPRSDSWSPVRDK